MPFSDNVGPRWFPSGVIVDHVENHLDSRRVKRLDHGFELVHLVAQSARRVPHVWGKEADRVVSPVIRQAFLRQMPIDDELVHRQQLDRGHVERLEIVDHRIATEAEIGPAQILGYVRILDRHPLHVGLVDDGTIPRRLRMAVVVPGERVVDDDAFGHSSGAIGVVDLEIVSRMAHLVGKERVIPLDLARDRLGVGIDEQLGRIEPVTVLGIVRAMDPEAVELARSHVGEKAVPDLVGPFPKQNLVLLDRIVRPLEQTELDGGRVLGEDGEVDALSVPGGAEGVGKAGPDAHLEAGSR